MTSDRFAFLSRRPWAVVAIAGIVVWLIGIVAAQPKGLAGLWFLGETLLFAILVVVPLGLELARCPDREGRHPWPWRTALMLHPLTAIGAVVALHIDTPIVKGAGAALWFLQTLVIAAFGLHRWCWTGVVALEEVLINLGLVYVPVGGFWLLAHCAGWNFGFEGFIVLLTAIHFHFAGFAAAIIAGLIGRLVPRANSRPRRVYRAAALPIGLAPPLIAIGIAASPALEIVSAAILAGAVALLSGLILSWVIWRVQQKLARALLAVASAGVLVPMVLAVLYAIGEFSHKPLIDLQTMVAWHGWFNAYGFAGAASIALVLLNTRSRLPDPWPPLSRLRSSGPVGPDFFRRLNLEQLRTPPACGLVDALEDYRRNGFSPEDVGAPIRDFYEHTREWALHVRARWLFPFNVFAPLFRVWARRSGQLVLPMADLAETDMENRITDLDDAADGRSHVRAWIRTCRTSGHPVYVAAYSTHRSNDIPYMNIAFPLPGGNLTSILRLDHRHDSDRSVVLSTRPLGPRVGDEGIYLVRGRIRARLPFQETISVWTAEEAPNDFPSDLRPKGAFGCCARHDVWLCGLRCLTLLYRLERQQSSA